jgi:hypothetical protein
MVVKFFHFFRVVCVVGMGFEEEFLDNSDLFVFGQSVVPVATVG